MGLAEAIGEAFGGFAKNEQLRPTAKLSARCAAVSISRTTASSLDIDLPCRLEDVPAPDPVGAAPDPHPADEINLPANRIAQFLFHPFVIEQTPCASASKVTRRSMSMGKHFGLQVNREIHRQLSAVTSYTPNGHLSEQSARRGERPK